MPTYECNECDVTTCKIVVEDGCEVETDYVNECVQDYGSCTADFILVAIKKLISGIDKESDTRENEFIDNVLKYDGDLSQSDIDEARSRIGLLHAKPEGFEGCECADVLFISPAGKDAMDLKVECCNE